jgi:ribose transport system substrate-binding protein
MQSMSQPRRGIDRWRRRSVPLVVLAATLIAAISLAACGSSSSSSSSSGSDPGSSTSSGETSETGGGVAAAKKALAPYTGHPSPFPVDQPLAKPVPKGAKFAYLQCSTPVCAIFGELLKGAVETAGGQLSIINAGASAASSQSAAASALAMKPEVVFITGVQPSSFGNSLKELSEAGAKVVSVSVAEETKPFGITFNFQGGSRVRTQRKASGGLGRDDPGARSKRRVLHGPRAELHADHARIL